MIAAKITITGALAMFFAMLTVRALDQEPESYPALALFLLVVLFFGGALATLIGFQWMLWGEWC